MPYGFYHVLHLICLVFMVSSFTLLLKRDSNPKLVQIISGISSLFLFVSGMGLLAKAKFGLEPWVIGKLGIWLILAILVPVTAKRFPNKKAAVYSLAMTLVSIAIYLVSTKLM